MFSKSRVIRSIVYLIIVPLILLFSILIFQGENYLLISIIFSFVACFPFYYKYEKRKPEAREIIIVAIMCALAIVSRILFAFLPGIKPMVAIIIITGAAFGKESGFMCGALTAVISNMFFGQGPWTAYQMIIYGMVGYLAGLFQQRKLLDKAWFRYAFALFAGLMFSIIIDFFTAVGSGFTISKYLALVIASTPFMMYYAISNIIFLVILYKPLMRRLNRVKLKYGLMNEERHIKLNEGVLE